MTPSPLSVPFDIDNFEGENAFVVVGNFRRAAKRAGYSPEDIARVTEKATSGDYEHLIATIKANCEEI